MSDSFFDDPLDIPDPDADPATGKYRNPYRNTLGGSMTHKQQVRDGLQFLVNHALTGKCDVNYNLDSGNITIKYDDDSQSVTLNVTIGNKFVAQYVPSVDEDVVTDAALDCVYSLYQQAKGGEA